jgi:poly(3-hydroxybutyrate) depolymerase
VRRALCVLAVVLVGCGGSMAHTAPPRASRCAQRLPLETLLDVPSGPRTARPLILALHGARQGGYGMQRYTGLSDDARGFVVAYPNTPHDNGFWNVEDVPRLLALVDAIGRCVPITSVSAVGFSNGGLMANALACNAADRVRTSCWSPRASRERPPHRAARAPRRTGPDAGGGARAPSVDSVAYMPTQSTLAHGRLSLGAVPARRRARRAAERKRALDGWSMPRGSIARGPDRLTGRD